MASMPRAASHSRVEKYGGRLARVYALEKAASARRLLCGLRSALAVVKSGYTAHYYAVLVAEQPPYGLAILEKPVLSGVENTLYIVIPRSDVGVATGIYSVHHIEESFAVRSRFDLGECIFSHIFVYLS